KTYIGVDMDQVIVFDKSLQQRLQEYLDILSGHSILSVSNIKKEWAFFLELSIDVSGWQAIWKLPRLTCELYKISFPTIVLVYVEDIYFESLEALVKVLAVQDDISLPEKHKVSLIQLWPTKTQDKSVVLNLQSTANALDILRFFYHNLITPWDYEDDDTADWLGRHLESRLRLFYDLKNGVIPRTASEHIRSLLVEARRLQARREQLEIEIGNDDDLEMSNGDGENEKVEKLMELHVRITQIKNEMEILENPLMRNVILKQQKEWASKKGDADPKCWLISETSKPKDHVNFLKQVEQFYPNESFTFAVDLAATLMELVHTNILILNKSKYHLKSVAKFESGAIIKGIYEKQDTIIESQSEDLMLDISGEVVIENITLNASTPQCCVVVRNGKLILRNCNLIGDTTSSIHQGIIVLDGSQLEMMDCDITGFATAIVGNSGSKVFIRNSKVHDVNCGAKVYENCLITVQKSSFLNCKEYGFCVETDQIIENAKKVGGFDVLESVPDINFDDLNGENNGKGDVRINSGQRIIPIKDLFTNLNLTYGGEGECDSGDDEEMEVTNEEDLNNTVIEKTESDTLLHAS
ncbi:hypothetical protein AMK59_6912, partial [Oryctes borbonicus]